MFIVREFRERDLTPEIRCKERIRLCDLSICQKNMDDSQFRAHTAAKVAFKKLPIVAVEPFDCV